MVLDLWVPKGRTDCPLVIYVHGGAYSGGSKYLSKGFKTLGERLMDQGIAFAALNYVLMPKGIRPQVWYDYRDAARFLRIYAEKFRLDPTKFGAYGMSAGGWLITTAGHGTGDHFANDLNGQGARLYDFIANGFKPVMRKEGEHASVWGSMQNEDPGWPGEYGGWQALAFDFKALDKFATSGSPVMLDLVGLGHRMKKPKPPKLKPSIPPPPTMYELMQSSIIDYSFAEMTAPKFVGKNVHVPPLIGKPGTSEKSQNEYSLTKHVVGEGEAELADVVVAWFVDRLDSKNARAPVPEIWPAMRVIDGPREVRMVVPKGPITVHYTIDGSDPTTDSPIYTQPFTVDGNTVVKALAVMPKRKPSGVAIATYVTGPVPPRLVYSERVLPPAQSGQPYSFTFEANQEKARFWMKGDLRPYTKRKTKEVVNPNNMVLDSHTGVWSGTPTQPGTYWVQIAVQKGPGHIATLRNFTWTVTGEATTTDTPARVTETDTNVELIHFPKLSEKDRQGLLEASDRAGLDLVIQEDGGFLFLVPKDQLPEAKAMVGEYFKAGLPAGAGWMQ